MIQVNETVADLKKYSLFSPTNDHNTIFSCFLLLVFIDLQGSYFLHIYICLKVIMFVFYYYYLIIGSHHHHQSTVVAFIEFTSPRQTSLSSITVSRSSVLMLVSLKTTSGNNNFLTLARSELDFQRRREEITSFLASSSGLQIALFQIEQVHVGDYHRCQRLMDVFSIRGFGLS